MPTLTPDTQYVERVATATIPTRRGSFVAHGYRDLREDHEHVALVHGHPARVDAPLVRLHSECLTGDLFGSLRCDCGSQLEAALDAIVAAGSGIVVYLRGHEGRGIGITHKLKAYALQEEGLDTVDANLALGLPVDARDYAVGAHILSDLGVQRISLLTNNPLKHDELSTHGITVVERIPLAGEPNAYNRSYLETKRDRLGHDLVAPVEPVPPVG